MKKISIANNVKHIDQNFETKNRWSKIAIKSKHITKNCNELFPYWVPSALYFYFY